MQDRATRHTAFGRMMTCGLALLLALQLAGCVEQEETIGEPVRQTEEKPAGNLLAIAEVTGSPDKYAGKEVAVRGRVEPGLAFQWVNEQPYRLTDPGGTLWVITTEEMPPEGRQIRVQGVVTAPYQIKGRRFEVVLIETERRP